MSFRKSTVIQVLCSSILGYSCRFLKAAGGYNDWPQGRGIFFNNNKTFLVWANEEDHLRLISMQKGGDLAAVYKRLVTVGLKLAFAFSFPWFLASRSFLTAASERLTAISFQLPAPSAEKA